MMPNDKDSVVTIFEFLSVQFFSRLLFITTFEFLSFLSVQDYKMLMFITTFELLSALAHLQIPCLDFETKLNINCVTNRCDEHHFSISSKF